VAFAALLVQGVALFFVVPRYYRARTASSLWQTRAEEVRVELLRLQEHAVHEDEDTGVGNARELEIDFAKCVARARRNGEPFSLALIEVSHTLRRDAVGNESIVAVAGVLLAGARAEDSICRVDDRLFAVLLAGADAEGGAQFVEGVRTRVAAGMFRTGANLRLLEIRGGVAQWSDEVGTLATLGRQARRDLDRESANITRQSAAFEARTAS
jgi:PleD family two-component response regulator